MQLLDNVKMAVARRKLSSRKIEGSDDALEIWIHNKIRAEFKGSKEFREAIGRDELGEIKNQDVTEYQLHKLRKMLEYVSENSYHYRKVLNDAGIRPSDIRTIKDMEKIPVTDPSELAAEPFQFLCASQSKVMRAFTTSGTSGTRKRLFYTRNDVLNIIDSIAAALKAQGMTDGDTLQIMFPAVAAWDPSLMLDGACKIAGFSSVVASTADVDEQVKLMKENHTTMMIGLTSFIYRISVLAKDKHDLRSMGIKAIICSAEPLPEAMRRELISIWGCKVVAQYGMTEMGLASSIECGAYDGLHVNNADFIVEVVDPATGKQLGEREEGEMLWTSLSMEGTPLIRYRTRDLSCIIEPPCKCGFGTGIKIGKIMGRMDAQTKIGYGQKIYPLLFDEVVLAVPGVLSYDLVLDRDDYRDILTFRVEFKGDKEEGRKKIIARLEGLDEIKDARQNDLIAPLMVEMLDVGCAPFEPKHQPIIDRREQYDADRSPGERAERPAAASN